MVAIPAAVAIGLSAASAAAGVAGTVVSGINQSQQARQQQATANYNAQVEQQQALAERQQHESQDEQQFAANNQKLGQIRALYGASGIEASGSPLDVLQGNASQMAYQTSEGDYTEQLRQMGYTSEAQGQEAQASAYGRQASYDSGLGMAMSVTGSVLQGLSSVAGAGQSNGAFGGSGAYGQAGLSASDPYGGAGTSADAPLVRAG